MGRNGVWEFGLLVFFLIGFSVLASSHRSPGPTEERSPSMVVADGLAIGRIEDGDIVIVAIKADGSTWVVKKGTVDYAIFLLNHVNDLMPKLDDETRDEMKPQVRSLRELLDTLKARDQ